MKKIKKLCDIKKSKYYLYEKEILKIIENPKFICKKCDRTANKKKYLCKSKSL